MSTKSILYDELCRLLSGIHAAGLSSNSKGGIRPRWQQFNAVITKTMDDSFLEDVLAMRLRGDTYSKIATQLNREGIEGLNGGRWYYSSLRRFMKSRCCEFVCDWPKL